jgi:hypothetical protein
MTTRDTARRKGGPRAIGAIAREVTGGAFQRHGLGTGEIAHAWREIVGAELAAMSRPERIAPPRKGGRSGGTLHVIATGACALDLHYASAGIVATVNAMLGHAAISSVTVRQAPPGEAGTEATPRTPDAPPEVAGDEIGGIDRPSLRMALARLGAGVRSDLDRRRISR